MVGSWNPIISQGFSTIHKVVVWDFWTINSCSMLGGDLQMSNEKMAPSCLEYFLGMKLWNYPQLCGEYNKSL